MTGEAFLPLVQSRDVAVSCENLFDFRPVDDFVHLFEGLPR
jgi:hypothetical protein